MGGRTVAELLDTLEIHERHERDFIEDYKRAAEKVQGSHIGLLLELIVSDEEKHHALISAMANTVRSSIVGIELEGTLRSGQRPDRGVLAEILALTDQLIDAETRGIKADSRLQSACDDVADGFFALILGTMVLDSRKHLLILNFIRDWIRKQSDRRSPDVSATE